MHLAFKLSHQTSFHHFLPGLRPMGTINNRIRATFLMVKLVARARAQAIGKILPYVSLKLWIPTQSPSPDLQRNNLSWYVTIPLPQWPVIY